MKKAMMLTIKYPSSSTCMVQGAHTHNWKDLQDKIQGYLKLHEAAHLVSFDDN
jgi:hypothetical protein